jgi:prepilin-type N-terminal cleavage/methylation domain-containing protein
VTLLAGKLRTLRGMNRRGDRRAFTIVEVLVALVIMGVACAGLAGGLAGDRRLRDLAAGDLFAADRARERIELLAALPCAGESVGSSASAWGFERWRAVPATAAWRLTDSLFIRGSAAPIVFDLRVACPG